MGNKLFLISGHSGSGKSSLMKSLMENELISFTTRPKRKGEVDGKDYHFITEKEYSTMYNNKELAEYTYYDGNRYGLTKEELDNKLSKNHAFVIVDVNGMEQLKKYYDNCTTIMLHTTKEDAMKQMLNRGDSAKDIETRLKTYQRELQNKQFYDYVVLNRHGKFDTTKRVLECILTEEACMKEDE